MIYFAVTKHPNSQARLGPSRAPREFYQVRLLQTGFWSEKNRRDIFVLRLKLTRSETSPGLVPMPGEAGALGR